MISSLAAILQNDMDHRYQAAIDCGLIPQVSLRKLQEAQIRLQALLNEGFPEEKIDIHLLRAVYYASESRPPPEHQKKWEMLVAQYKIDEEALHIAREELKDSEGHFQPLLLGGEPIAGEIAAAMFVEYPAWNVLHCVQHAAKIEKYLQDGVTASAKAESKSLRGAMRFIYQDAQTAFSDDILPQPIKTAMLAESKAADFAAKYKMGLYQNLRVGWESSLERAELAQEAANAWKGAVTMMEETLPSIEKHDPILYHNTCEMVKALALEAQRAQREATNRVQVINSALAPLREKDGTYRNTGPADLLKLKAKLEASEVLKGTLEALHNQGQSRLTPG